MLDRAIQCREYYGAVYNAIFQQGNNYLIADRCKEVSLYRAINSPGGEYEIFFMLSVHAVQKVLSFWEESKLPKFEHEIIKQGNIQGLYINGQETFGSLIYLDVLISLLKSVNKRGAGKSLLEKVNNGGAWANLRDAIALVINNSDKNLYSAGLAKKFYPNPTKMWGMAKSYSAGDLQRIVENA
jgi:hypothetical protein